MTKVAPRSIAIPRLRAAVYLRRGTNLVAAMEQSLGSGNNDGAATSGVQAAISFADAYTVAKCGLRSRGQDHHEAVALVSGVGSPPAKRLATLLQKILNRKSAVEYGDRDVTSEDASEIARAVREVHTIVKREID